MSIRYIKYFETFMEQRKLMNHLDRIGIEYDYGIKIVDGCKLYYVKAFN